MKPTARIYLTAIAALMLGAAIGASMAGRYQLEPVPGGYPMRLDRWTGRVELVEPRMAMP